MCTTFSAWLFKFNSTNWSAFAGHRKYCVNKVLGFGNKSIQRKLNYVVNPLEEIMNTVPPESEALSPNDTLNIFRQLSESSRTLSSSSPSFNIVNHKNFTILREAMKVSLSYLKVTEKFDLLKAIQNLSVPPNDNVYSTIFTSLLDNVFNMSLNDIMVIDALLVSNQINPVARELHQSLVDRFNAKTSQLPVEFNYFMRIRRILQFINRNRYQIIDETFLNIRNCAKKREIDIFTAHEAMQTIRILSNFGDKCEYFQAILDKAFDVWSDNDVTIQMVDRTLTYLKERISITNYSMFKDTRFIEKCARVAIENADLDECFAIQRKLNRLEFSSKQLFNYLLKNVKDTTVKENFVPNSVTICTACYVANYRPPIFEDNLFPALATMNFHQYLDQKLNWPKFALRLNNMGVYHKLLIQEILKQRQHFEPINESSFRELEILEMEKLINAPVCHFLPDLKAIFGEHIRLLVNVDRGGTVPLLVKIDIHSKNFVSFVESEAYLLSSIQCGDNQCLIAIFGSCPIDSGVDIELLRSSHPNVIAISLNPSEWVTLLQHKTTDEFFSAISDHVQNQIINHEATNIFQ